MSKQKTTNPFYLFDLIAKLFKSKNIPAILYLTLNIAIVSLIFYELFFKSPIAILYGVVVYLIAAVIAISPVGEWILRLTQGCSKLKTDNPKQLAILNRLEPLFVEVLNRARSKQVDYAISDMHHIVRRKLLWIILESSRLRAMAILLLKFILISLQVMRRWLHMLIGEHLLGLNP